MPLAFYSRSATADFWAEHWTGEDVDGLLATAETSPLTRLIERALPAGGQVLEAGCGLGQYVILLRRRGRAVAGADWSLDGLRRCRAASPSAPLAVMDLAQLAVRSGALAGYVSLGVVEHDPEGPDAIVADAARALAPGGRLVLSVPYVNGVRRLLARRLAGEARRSGRRAGSSTSSRSAAARCERSSRPMGSGCWRFTPTIPPGCGGRALDGWPRASERSAASAEAPGAVGGRGRRCSRGASRAPRS